MLPSLSPIFSKTLSVSSLAMDRLWKDWLSTETSLSCILSETSDPEAEDSTSKSLSEYFSPGGDDRALAFLSPLLLLRSEDARDDRDLWLLPLLFLVEVPLEAALDD